MHPMTQLSINILLCQPRSKFAKAYEKGLRKEKFWETTLEDGLDLLARIPRMAALIYHNCYKENSKIANPDETLDYSANFCNMLGFNQKEFYDLMRLYIVLHA